MKKHQLIKKINSIIILLLLGLCLLSCNNQSSKQVKESDSWISEVDTSICIEIGTLSDLDLSFKYDKVSTSLVKDLVDVYNSFNILNSIYNDFELWVRFDINIIDVQGAIDKIDCSVVHDDSIKVYTCDYKKHVLSLLQDTAVHDSIKFEKMGMEYSAVYNKLVNRYHVSHYGELSEDKYWKIYDPRNIIQDYDSIYSLRGTDDSLSIAYLKQLADNSKRFDEKCIYTLEYAHAKIDDFEHPAIPCLEQLIKSNTYSIYLKEIWQTWRCLLQISLGSSKDSEIPNDRYNRMRMICAHTILDYIVQHPNDIIAINQFIILSSEDNIDRYGVYTYGNQNMMEQIEIFYEQFKDILEKEEDAS